MNLNIINIVALVGKVNKGQNFKVLYELVMRWCCIQHKSVLCILLALEARSLTETSKFVRILGCVFFFAPLLSSSSTCMRSNGNVIQVHHRFARRKFSQLVAVNTSETGDTHGLFSFPEASSSRARTRQKLEIPMACSLSRKHHHRALARSLWIFSWFWFCFFVFFFK
jgi:hypothetical protein